MRAFLLLMLVLVSFFVFGQGGGLSRASREATENFDDQFTSHFKYEIQNVDRRGRYISTEATGRTVLDWKLSYSTSGNLYHQSIHLRHTPTLNYRALYGNRHTGTINSNGLNLLLHGSEEHYSTSYYPGQFFNANVYARLTTLDGRFAYSSSRTTRQLPFWLWLGSPEPGDFRERLLVADYLDDPYANNMVRARFHFQVNCPLPSTLSFPRGVSYRCRTAYVRCNRLLSRFRQPYWQAITTIQFYQGQRTEVIQAIIVRFGAVRIIWTSVENPRIIDWSLATHNPAAAMQPCDPWSCSVTAGQPEPVPCLPAVPVLAAPPPALPVAAILNNAAVPPARGSPDPEQWQLIRNDLSASPGLPFFP